MIIRKFAVQYVSDGPSAEPVSFTVVQTQSSVASGTINIHAELVQKILGKNVGDVVRLASGEKCIIVDIDQEIQLDDILKELKRTQANREDTEWVSLGTQLARLLSDSVRINPFELRKNTCESVVSAFLNEDRVAEALELVERLQLSGIPGLDDHITRLKEIQTTQKHLTIQDILDTFLLRRLAKLHTEIKAYRKAKELYLRSLELEPGNPYTLNSLGGVCRRANWLGDGIEYYKRALEAPGNSAVVTLNGLGAIYRAQQNFAQALTCYTQALELDNSNTISHSGIGAVYFDMQHYLEGQKHFRRAGRSIASLLELFDEYAQAGLADQAAKCLQTILEIDKYNQKAKQLLQEMNANNLCAGDF